MGLGREDLKAVIATRRARVLDALVEVVAERGLREASVAAVAKRAAISRAAFGEVFANIDECFCALVDSMLEAVTESVEDGFAEKGTWQERVIAGLSAAMALLDSSPMRARVCLLESADMPSDLRRRRVQLLNRLRALLDQAREQLPEERQPPAPTAEATVAAVLGILRSRLLCGEAPPLMPLLDSLVEVVVASYLGPGAAASAAKLAREEIRLTRVEPLKYGTFVGVEIPGILCHGSSRRLRSCLLCVAEHPGASNQRIAEEIGVSHSGQVSTLLGRLHRAGLLLRGGGGGGGQPNAWSLSPYGAEVARALDDR